MAGLYDLNDNLITGHVRLVAPGYNTVFRENRLLTGDWHVMTIGSGARHVLVHIICDSACMQAVEAAMSTATPLKVTGESRYYIGVIRPQQQGVIPWQRRGGVAWETTLTLLVSDEGELAS